MKKRIISFLTASMFIIPVVSYSVVGKFATVKDIGKEKNGVGGKSVKLNHIEHKKNKDCKKCHDLTRKTPQKIKVHTYCKACHKKNKGPKTCVGCHK